MLDFPCAGRYLACVTLWVVRLLVLTRGLRRLNKSLSPLQKRTQGAPDLVRAGVGRYGA